MREQEPLIALAMRLHPRGTGQRPIEEVGARGEGCTARGVGEGAVAESARAGGGGEGQEDEEACSERRYDLPVLHYYARAVLAEAGGHLARRDEGRHGVGRLREKDDGVAEQ